MALRGELQTGGIVRDGLSRQVADQLRAAIVEGRLKVDDRLPNEDGLAQHFGVSRATIREALKILAAQNLIRSRRGPAGGTFVSRPDPQGLGSAIADAAMLLVGTGDIGMEDMLTARAETEAVCCRLAARARTADDLAALRAELALQRDPTLRDEEFCASDLRFHRALVQATHNPPLKLMMYAVIESFIPVTNMLIYRDHERRLSVDLHEAITDAVAAGEGPRAAELMARHLEGMRGLLTATLDRRAAGPAV
ncbi:MAG TPA: FadR family transcriptional regulator [Citreicella sp.]|jgi:GntR family transcriptional regulator, transcriptional repressor for pyruvate dehydrogenase complex|nr:FadR family transcriptional regulator [Citreicella sp.]HBS99235.1 FadR family transcriptional regulator [Citreicella sp.]